ncbi:Glycosyltransferase 61 [Dillenia turbinata]|uniref:Glycosyltransferase 61 n=1 Tax=Dillenia turbinata TaxID=194707 RepID=A0AAN8UT35_9MAGN
MAVCRDDLASCRFTLSFPNQENLGENQKCAHSIFQAKIAMDWTLSGLLHGIELFNHPKKLQGFSIALTSYYAHIELPSENAFEFIFRLQNHFLSCVVSMAEMKSKPLCNFLGRNSDFCDIRGDIHVYGNSSTIFVVSPETKGILVGNDSWSIRPYCRKYRKGIMNQTKEWTVKAVVDQQRLPDCTKTHAKPAVLFSEGGYAGNFFHSFADVIVPLYLTSQQFNGEVQFLVTQMKTWWNWKYQRILKSLSKYEIIDIDKEEEIHCFTSIHVGLQRYNDLKIDASISPHGISMKDFGKFLRSTYSLKRSSAIRLRDGGRKRPRLLIISRKRTRRFTNEDEIAQMAKDLGYEVVMLEANSNITSFSRIVNSCDVMMGVHGAGLTNMVFLPEKAVLVQVIGIGHEWISREYFGEPAVDMNLKYLAYNTSIQESTLTHEYPHVLRNPSSIAKQELRDIYLTKQNVKLNLSRFRPTLLRALELLND